MPVLPSGRSVGIMSERARQHAKRLKLRITEETPHHQLYPLVDILIEQPGGHYGFSSHTLADLGWINQWPERDRRFFFSWIREISQVSTIELARRRLLVEQHVPREQVYPYSGRLFSELKQRVAALPQARASALQWQRTLLNMRSDGLRRDELDWSGILDFLRRQPREVMIERQVVLDAIDFSAIRPRLTVELECDRGCRLPLREVAQRLAAYQLQLAGLAVGERDVGVIRYCSSAPNYRIGTLWHDGHSLQAAGWFLLGPYGQAIFGDEIATGQLFASAEEAMAVANRHAQRSHRLRCDITESRRYEYMSLHGGEVYREWLVTLPDYHRSHFTAHYHERNVLLHIRTKERIARNGHRVLFIEELQSDWHQAASRYGLRSGIPVAPFRREWAALALKLMLLHVVERGLDGIAWADAAVHEQRYDRRMTPLQRLYDQEMPRTLNHLAAPWGGRVGSGAGGGGGVGSGEFATRRPWLHAARSKEQWRVEGGAGRFVTRARYNKEEALAVIARHSAAVTLQLPMLLLPQGMRHHIAEHGLPLFGERLARHESTSQDLSDK